MINIRILAIIALNGLIFPVYAQTPASPTPPAAAPLIRDVGNQEIKEGIKNYLDHLSGCQAGEYSVTALYVGDKPIPYIFKIEGWDGNDCKVVFFSPLVQPNGDVNGAMRLDCKFDRVTIDKQIKQFRTDYPTDAFQYFLDTPIGITMVPHCVRQQ